MPQTDMKLAWLTDMHLNFVGRSAVEGLCNAIRSTGTDAILITGDIATSLYLCRYLQYLAEDLRRPIYFVLGNHDYYGSSIRSVNAQVTKVVEESQHLVWLSRSGVVELLHDTCLIGHEGLADGRLGDPEGSEVDLNDYHHIEELHQPTKERRLHVQNMLGDAAAEHLESNLKSAIGKYKKIIVALHAPPFREACWHLGQNSDDNYLPHFACKATGEVLKAAMAKHPDTSMTVYCGHTHSGGYTEILPNLRVFTAGAEYRHPSIASIIQV
jgi:3',5'-cyclic AMP phosphodiesterase CpdA